MSKADYVARREAILNLWAEGKSSREIADRIEGVDELSAQGFVRRARAAKDPRAAHHRVPRTVNEAAAERRDEILNLFAGGSSSNKIAKSLGIDQNAVRRTVERAWLRDEDPRAKPRNFKPSDQAKQDWMLDTRVTPVPLAPVKFLGTPASLRPIAYSIDREQSQQETSLTARLMGDPDPMRSALKRPLRPDEWASKGGEGRFTTAFHSGGQTRVRVAASPSRDQ